MKYKIITSPKLISLLTGKMASAMAFFPFILVRESNFKENKVLINHEIIHLRQQLELLLVIFYLWYLLEYLIRLIIYRNHYKAYRNISFEKEAFDNECDFEYNKRKNFWSFLNYIK